MAEDSVKGVSKAFLANFVHQIVNPVNGVIGTLDNVHDGTYSGDVAAQKINASRAQLEQCVTLLRNLAYLSEYFSDSGPSGSVRPVREGAISVVPQVAIEAMQFFQIPAKTRGIRLELDDPRSQYRVFTRPELLRQIFINLFDNWVKYGKTDTRVSVQTKVNSRRDLVIEISGQSIGFSAAEANSLFDFRYRSKLAESKIAQGSGIGLYICKEIVERELNGKISAVHSKKTEISTFRISVPEKNWSI